MNNAKFLLLNAVISAIVTLGVLGLKDRSQVAPKSTNDLIKEFYLIENAVHVSPHSIRKSIAEGKNNFTLVDLRSKEEYEKEHVTGAINIPAYLDPNTSISLDKPGDDRERIIEDFKALPKDKDIIVYCYSMPCMTGRKIGLLLANNGIYVKHLGIGWNEWRYYWNLWNHDSEKPSKMEDYVTSGKEPGVFKKEPTLEPCVEGEFGC